MTNQHKKNMNSPEHGAALAALDVRAGLQNLRPLLNAGIENELAEEVGSARARAAMREAIKGQNDEW